MRELDWDSFINLPGAPTRNWEQLCRAAVRRNYGSKGDFRSVAQQPGVEFHLRLTEDCGELGGPGRWWGWQCRWYDLPAGRKIGETRRERIAEAIRTTAKWLPDMTDWVLWTRRQLTPGDQKWFREIETDMRLHLRSSDDLGDLLTGDAAALREAYFGELVLTPEKLTELWKEGVAPVRRRYDPAVHVKVEAEAVVEEILGDPGPWKDLAWRAHRLAERSRRLQADARRLPAGDAEGGVLARLVEDAAALEQRLRDISGLIMASGAGQALARATQRLPAAVSRRLLERTLVRLRTRHEPAGLGALELASEMRRAGRLIDGLIERLKVEMCAVVGGAGLGKSHLAVDVSAPKDDRPAGIYLQAKKLGARDTLDDLLRQIMKMPTTKFVDLLEGLDAAGGRANRRLPLLIDGLNESEDPAAWKDLLDRLKVVIANYPNVLVVLTLRESAIDYALPDDVYNIDLLGFREELREAVDRYFKHYKLRAGEEARLPWRHFRQPLFLRMYCQVANPEPDPERRRPVDVSTLPTSPTTVYEAFRDEAVRRIATEQLRVAERDVTQGLHRVALELWKRRARSLDFDEVRRLVDLGPGPWNQSIAFALEDEGVLMRDPGPHAGTQLSGILHDEFAGFLIADAIVADAGASGIDHWLRDSENLAALSREPGEGHPLAADILKGFVGVLPRRAFRSLWPYLEGADRDDALVWAADLEPSRIDYETTAAIEQLMATGTTHAFRTLMVRLHDVRADPTHPLNADFLDRVLRQLDVATRDLRWTEWIRHANDPGWPRRVGAIERDVDALEVRWRERVERGARERLRAVWLSWLLTSTDRGVRDRATRALYRYGRRAPRQLFELALASLIVNDPYVPDRVMAASYGVVMANQRPETDDFGLALKGLLRGLANALLGEDATAPTSNWLIREYATSAWKFATVLYPDVAAKVPANWLARLASGKTPRGFGENSRRGKQVFGAIGMDFENYTVGRLYEDRSNYDYNHKAYRAGMAEIRARIHELGWRENVFKPIERQIADSHGYMRRHEVGSQIERYGKKYSLIAFYELAGRLQDRDRLPRDPTTRLSDVDIDPSFPELPASLEVDMPRWARTTPADLRRWVRHGKIAVPEQLIRRAELQGHPGPWVLVDGSIRDADEITGRTVWGHMRALMVSSRSAANTVRAIAGLTRWSGLHWPDEPSDYYTFAGEVPWSDEFAASVYHYEADPYVSEIDLPGAPNVSVEVLSHRYSWESYHSELNDAGGVSVPSRRLSEHGRLLRVPEGFDHVDPEDRMASQLVLAPEQVTSGNLLYVREDVLDAYAKSRRRKVILFAFGERQPSYELVRGRPRWFLNVGRDRADEWSHVWLLDGLR